MEEHTDEQIGRSFIVEDAVAYLQDHSYAAEQVA